MSTALDAVLDRAALRELGYARSTIDLMYEQLDVIAFPGQRKLYLRAEDVARFVAEHTYDGRTRVRTT